MGVKIVDDFNGYEGPSFVERADAEAELAQRRKDVYAHPGQQHAQFRQVIVPAHYQWYFDQRRNTFVWGA